MGTQNNDEGVLTTIEGGVVNSNTYPDQLRPYEDVADDQPLANLVIKSRESGEPSSDMIPQKAKIVKVIWKPGDKGCPEGFYECAITIPRMDLFSVTQRYKPGVKNKSNAVINFARRARGYVETKPFIGQDCDVLAPATGDPSIMHTLVKLADRQGSIDGKSDQLAKPTSAQDAVTTGGPPPDVELICLTNPNHDLCGVG